MYMISSFSVTYVTEIALAGWQWWQLQQVTRAQKLSGPGLRGVLVSTRVGASAAEDFGLSGAFNCYIGQLSLVMVT